MIYFRSAIHEIASGRKNVNYCYHYSEQFQNSTSTFLQRNSNNKNFSGINYLAVVPSEKDPLFVNCLYSSPPGANSRII